VYCRILNQLFGIDSAVSEGEQVLYKVRGVISTICIFFPKFCIVMLFQCYCVPEYRNITIYIYECKLCFLLTLPQCSMVPCVRICDAVNSILSSRCHVSGWGSGIRTYSVILPV
jgi:hypothetical protein